MRLSGTSYETQCGISRSAAERESRRCGNFTQQLVPAVRRIADLEVHLGAVIEDAAGVRVGAKSPLAVVLAHPGVADTPERKVGNQWMDGAVVDHRIPRRRC